MEIQNSRQTTSVFDSKDLRRFFISHLNRLYCAKSQLADKLPLLRERANNPELQESLNYTIGMVKLQIKQFKDIYIALHGAYQPETCTGLKGFLDEAFQSVGTPGDSSASRDLSILFYMQNIESIEAVSFKLMLRVAEELKEPLVVQLLNECYKEAIGNQGLFQSITEKVFLKAK